jgi:hypothetical protein
MRLRDEYALQLQPTYRSSPWSQFWSRIGSRPAQQKAQFHVPIAGDLSSISASLLFGVAPRFRIAAAHEQQHTVKSPLLAGDPATQVDPDEGSDDIDILPAGDPAAQQTEERLKEIVDQGGMFNRLLEAAEAASALGGAYLVPVWDSTIADVPLVSIAQADAAVPVFKFGLLDSVIFHREISNDNDVIVRHLELHEKQPGKNAHVVNGVYRGSPNQLGSQLNASVLMELTGLKPEQDLPFPELDVEYVPNMRPNKLWRSSSLGLSDYSGSEQLFDALDEVYASWIRDIRLAKSRIIVPKEFIDEFGAFDVDHEVFTQVNMEPSTAAGAMPILAQQFTIRNAEHLATALEFIERIVSNAGYSPQTYGLHIMGRAESGTALRMRENRTMMTMARKTAWWTPAIERLARHLLLIDIEVFGTKIEAMPVDVELSDLLVRDDAELANTANILKQAMAASTQERVRMIHPDWTPEEISAEVARILDEGVPATAFAVSPAANDAPPPLDPNAAPPPPGQPPVPPTQGPTPGAPAAKPPVPTGTPAPKPVF